MAGDTAPRLRALERAVARLLVGRRRKEVMIELAIVPLLIIDDLGMRKLPTTAGEDLLELIMRRYERTAMLLTSNRPVADWANVLGDDAAVSALLDRLLHHAHVLQYGPRSWRTHGEFDEGNRDTVEQPRG